MKMRFVSMSQFQTTSRNRLPRVQINRRHESFSIDTYEIQSPQIGIQSPQTTIQPPQTTIQPPQIRIQPPQMTLQSPQKAPRPPLTPNVFNKTCQLETLEKAFCSYKHCCSRMDRL